VDVAARTAARVEAAPAKPAAISAIGGGTGRQLTSKRRCSLEGCRKEVIYHGRTPTTAPLGYYFPHRKAVQILMLGAEIVSKKIEPRRIFSLKGCCLIPYPYSPPGGPPVRGCVSVRIWPVVGAEEERRKGWGKKPKTNI
jgi:hypothetical protein